MDNQVSTDPDCHAPAHIVELVAENDGRVPSSDLSRLAEAAEAVERMHLAKDAHDFRHIGARVVGLDKQDGGKNGDAIDRLMDDNLSKYSISKPPYQTRSVTAKAKISQTHVDTPLDIAARRKAKEDLIEAQKRYDALTSPATPDISLIDVPTDCEDEHHLHEPLLHEKRNIVSSHNSVHSYARGLTSSTEVRPIRSDQQLRVQEVDKEQQIKDDQLLAQQLATALHTKYINKLPVVTPAPRQDQSVSVCNTEIVTLQQQVIELQKQILVSNAKQLPPQSNVYLTAASEMSSDTDSDWSAVTSDASVRTLGSVKNVTCNSKQHSITKQGKGPLNAVNALEHGDVRVSCSKSKGKENVKTCKCKRYGNHLKLVQYDGKTSLETFMIQFQTCCDYNGWNEREKEAQLKMALKDGALNVLLGNAENLNFDGIMKDLQNSFGTKGLEAQYESDLKNRRRKKNESMKGYYQEMHRLSSLAYSKYH